MKKEDNLRSNSRPEALRLISLLLVTSVDTIGFRTHDLNLGRYFLYVLNDD